MNGLFQDARYGIRQLRSKPAFTVVAIVTLALGIGANTAIFSLLDQALLRNLPVRDPGQLVLLKYVGSRQGRTSSYGGDSDNYFSYPMYRDIRDGNSVFNGVIATDAVQVGVQWQNQPELVSGELVSGNYFEVLGVRPALGRLFVASDDVAQNANPVAVLSFGYWKRRFGSDPRIVGRELLINGQPFAVVGIAQPGFHSVVLGQTPDVFTPMMMKPRVTPGWNDLDNRRSSWLNIIARLKPGVSVQQAEAGINPLWRSVRADEFKAMHDSSASFRESFVEKSRIFLLDAAKGFSPLREMVQTPLLIIAGMVGLLALMACANVASLLLVRAASRTREMSIRYALGAERTRVLRQLLVEGLLLGLTGGLLGVLIAPQVSGVLTRELAGSTPGDLPFSSQIDVRILLFNFGLSVAVSLIFSLAPLVQFWRPNLTPALKQQVVSAAGGPLHFRRASVAVQVGLSLLLLVGAGLFVRTLQNLKSLDIGFAADHLLTFRIDPGLAGYEEGRTPELYRRVLDTLRAVPGVQSVGATSSPELDNDDSGSNITVAGYTSTPGESMRVQRSRITEEYFSSLHMPVLAGRAVSDQDTAKTARVVVVNESFAKHFFGDPRRAVGRAFGWGGGSGVKMDVQIVGVARDAKHRNLREEIADTVFEPYLQQEIPGSMAFYIRTAQPPENAENTIRVAMQGLDPKLVLASFRTMEEQIDESLSLERMISLLATSFAVLAVFMAAVGLYGVLAYSTAQRTREIGVRIALGASRASVLKLVLMEVLWLAGTGIVVALPITLLLTRTLRGQLFGISSSDPWTISFVTLLLAAVAVVSALIPARRAARVDPIVALRYE